MGFDSSTCVDIPLHVMLFDLTVYYLSSDLIGSLSFVSFMVLASAPERDYIPPRIIELVTICHV